MSSETSATTQTASLGDDGIVMSLLRLRVVARQAAIARIQAGAVRSLGAVTALAGSARRR